MNFPISFLYVHLTTQWVQYMYVKKCVFDALSVFGTKHYVLSHFQIPCGGCNRKFHPRCTPKKNVCLVCLATGDWSHVQDKIQGKVDRPSTVPSGVQGKVNHPSTVPSGVQGKIDDPSTVPRGAYKCIHLNKRPKRCQGCLKTFVHGFECHVLVRYERTTYQPPSGPQRVTWRNCYYHVVMACIRKTNAAGTVVVVIAEDVEAGTAKFLQESGFFHI